jgi:DNA-binding PadR family transcriptional regulator
MDDSQKIVENLMLELRRGTIVLSVLSQLKEPKYGYALVQNLEEKQVAVDAGTLYPLLRRLEKQGLLHSEWETTGAKPRKYYVLSKAGSEVFLQLCKEWGDMVESTNRLIDDGGETDVK